MIERPRIVRSVLPDLRLDRILVARAVGEVRHALRFQDVALAVLDVLDDADGLLRVGCDDAAEPGEVSLDVGHADRIAGVAGEGDVG